MTDEQIKTLWHTTKVVEGEPYFVTFAKALLAARPAPQNVRERWNIERDGDDLLVCFNDHEKYEGCSYERFVPASSVAARPAPAILRWGAVMLKNPRYAAQPAPVALDHEALAAKGWTLQDCKVCGTSAAAMVAPAPVAVAGADEHDRRSESGMPMSANAPEKCPITRRPFFMVISHPELGWVPTYGGPYDSYTIPHMEGRPDEPYHERELTCHRYDHDVGGWVDDESISMRVINEDVLNELLAAANIFLKKRSR